MLPGNDEPTAATDGDRSSRRGPGTRLLDRYAPLATIDRVELVSPRIRRVTIAGDALAGQRWTPGQHVRVVLADMTRLRTWVSPRELRDASRSYSLWDYDPTAGVYQLLVLDHPGDGPGARWARQAAAGDAVRVGPPEGTFRTRAPSPYHLLAGEETASVCFSAMLRALPPRERVHAVIEAAGPLGHLGLPRAGDVIRVSGDGTTVSPSDALVRAVADLSLPDEPGVAYLAGEAKTVQAIRHHLLVERGWPRRAIQSTPFWTPGKRGLD